MRHAVGQGESMGALDTAFGKVADLYEQEVSRAISGLPLVLLPLAIVLFVLIIGGLALIQSF